MSTVRTGTRNSVIMVAAVAVALLALQASAVTVNWYDDETTFYNLTATWDVMEDFEDEAAGLSTPLASGNNTFAFTGGEVSGDSLSLWNGSRDSIRSTHAGTWPSPGDIGDGLIVTRSDLTFDFGADQYNAFGMTVTDWSDRVDNLQIALTAADGATETIALTNLPGSIVLNSDVFFLGFTSDVVFTKVTFMGLGDPNAIDGAGIDGVLAGNVAPVVPEPASMTLLGIGLAGLAARRLRRKQ